MEKSEIRRLVSQRKRQFTEQELRKLSLAVISKLCSLPEVARAKTILLYYSMWGEVGTHELVDSLYRQGKKVLLPKVVDGEKMVLIPYSGRQNLVEAGAFHILEPVGEPFTDYADIDVAVVPGVAFTTDGKRMGRGRGYYDRLLPSLVNAYKIGICFPFQLFGFIPTTSLDIPMDKVVTA